MQAEFGNRKIKFSLLAFDKDHLYASAAKNESKISHNRRYLFILNIVKDKFPSRGLSSLFFLSIKNIFSYLTWQEILALSISLAWKAFLPLF